MDSVHLLLRCAKSYLRHKSVWIASLLLFVGSHLHAQEALEFPSYAELKLAVTSRIAAAKTRVFIVSDFISDGDIVSSLYVAKYRQLSVGALLGRNKASAYMSRLMNLDQQGISVAARESRTKLGPTEIMIDNSLLVIESELDFRSKTSPIRMRQIPQNSSTWTDWETNYGQALAKGRATLPRPNIPIIREKGHTIKRAVVSPKQSSTKELTPEAVNQNSNGVKVNKDGMPITLPKVPLWMQREQQKMRTQDTQQ